jgi:hypothetical protein
MFEGRIAEGVRTWPVLLAPGQITSDRITKKHRWFTALRQAKSFRLDSHFALQVDRTCKAFWADLLHVFMPLMLQSVKSGWTVFIYDNERYSDTIWLFSCN